MCYLFGRSTGPVNIPPPVYYADLACERSRCYGDCDDDISDTSSTIGDDGGKPQGSRAEAQSASRGHGSGSLIPNRPAPSKQGPSNQRPSAQSTPGFSKYTPNKPGPGSTAPGGKGDALKTDLRPTEAKMPDLTAGLAKKEEAKLFEEGMAASQKAVTGGSSKAEGKEPEVKNVSHTGSKSGREAARRKHWRQG